MAANDKLASLTKYVQDMKDRLEKEQAPSRRQWMQKEISFHQKKIDAIRMSGEPAKK